MARFLKGGGGTYLVRGRRRLAQDCSFLFARSQSNWGPYWGPISKTIYQCKAFARLLTCFWVPLTAPTFPALRYCKRRGFDCHPLRSVRLRHPLTRSNFSSPPNPPYRDMLLQFATEHALPRQAVAKYSDYMRYICSPADDHKERLG